MTTITKEWLQQTIAEFENTRDDIPFGLDDDDAKILIVLKRALASLTAEPVRYLNKFSGTCVTLEQQPNASDDVAVYMPLYAAPPASEREQVRREHAEWSDATFGDVGPIGPLKHLSKEALEAAADPSDPLEWANMQFLLWDAQRRMGISDEFITRAMIEKLEINKSRQWPEPKEGEPRLHIKEQPATVVPEDLRRSFEAVARLNNEMYRWTSCMSYNGSYVGEPEGLLKRNIREIEHIMDSCRAAMLQGAEPVSQAYELPEIIEGMEVSVDVSTCDFDAGHRYFGTVTEVSELGTAKNGYILLVQDAKPNFDVNGNSPVIPGGWISCSERIPAQDDWILIYSKHGEYMAGQVQGEYVELSDGTLSWLGNALFWMQLPEPPL
ncbi:DUF550 domain-containing protein [Salmonella enterica]|nr:DUF550 domain-containing protein [Salmonella enterica]